MKSICFVLLFTALAPCAARAQTSAGVALTYNLPQGDFGDFARPALGYELAARRQWSRLFVDATLYYMQFELLKTTFSYLNALTGSPNFTTVTLNKNWNFYGFTLGGGRYFFEGRNWGIYGGASLCYLRGFREVREQTTYGNYSGETDVAGSKGKVGIVPRLGANIQCRRLRFVPEIRANFNFSEGIVAFNDFSDHHLGARDPFLQIALGIQYTLSYSPDFADPPDE